MAILNIEIKASCSDPSKIERYLKSNNAIFKGVDHQIDTYFNISDGRLKLRQGTIENNLIYYKRDNQCGPKKSEVILYNSHDPISLSQILEYSLGIKVRVIKVRKIYFIDNVKFHIDLVEDLGSFCEIEAIDDSGIITEQYLCDQCNHYINAFGIKPENLISDSYSDLILNKLGLSK